MSIFGSIMSKIFHHGEAQAAPAPQTSSSTSTASSTPSPGAPSTAPAGPLAPDVGNATASAGAPSPGSVASAGSSSTAGATPTGTVDVAAVLNGLASKNSQKLDWKHSIVDLMKLLDLDSSLTARKSLAEELHYSGSTDDSATMNIWLHKQVMQKLAENGGKVPEDLKN